MGDQNHLIAGDVSEQARQRFYKDISGIKHLRQKEREQFYSSIHAKKKLEDFGESIKKQNQKKNQDFVVKQIAERKLREAEERKYDQSYFKPHFGPEED